MALDLFKDGVKAEYQVGCLCIEAGVCLHDPDSNPVLIEAAEWAVSTGLIVTDEHGMRFRLRVTAERLPN